MRGKRKIALLLAAIMLLGTGSLLKPTEVQAEGETNTFTLGVPSDIVITKSGWNELDPVTVTGSIEESKLVELTITTDNNSMLKSGGNAIPYTIKKAQTDTTATSSIEFSATDVNGSTASQAIGVAVSNFSSKAAGTYEDTIEFKATLKNKPVGVFGCTDTTCSCSNKCFISEIRDLGNATEFTSAGKKYYAYNDFVPKTSAICWHQAQAFVAELNAAFPQGDGTKWMLLDSADMAYDWWLTTGTISGIGADKMGDVQGVWSTVEATFDEAQYWYLKIAKEKAEFGIGIPIIKSQSWKTASRGARLAYYGFVVMRG